MWGWEKERPGHLGPEEHHPHSKHLSSEPVSYDDSLPQVPPPPRLPSGRARGPFLFIFAVIVP